MIPTRTPLLVALLLAAPLSAEERDVRLETDAGAIVGTLRLPDAAELPPVVLLLHGFTGTRDELAVAGTEEGVFSRTARRLAEDGLASLRIDFRGSGESEGAWEDTTFSGQIADALAALDWLAGQEDVDGDRIAVLGWSQGGLVAAHAAAERPEIDALVLWAPAANPLWNFSSVLGAETVAAGLAADPDEIVTATLPWGAETRLRAGFFQELATTSPAAAAAGYRGPLLVIVGTEDTVVAPQPAAGEIFLRYHDGHEELVTLETDHAFGALDGPDTLDEMIDRSAAWIRDAVD